MYSRRISNIQVLYMGRQAVLDIFVFPMKFLEKTLTFSLSLPLSYVSAKYKSK